MDINTDVNNNANAKTNAKAPENRQPRVEVNQVVGNADGAHIVQLLCLNPQETLFENQYKLPDGMSYCSYVAYGTEKVGVVDTVELSMLEPWQQALRQELAGRKPDYLIVEHLEPDHSAGMGWFVKEYPDCKVVCSAKAAAMLPQFVDGVKADRVIKMGEGHTLGLGGLNLKFFMAPMVHWPEVMTAFEETTGTLFSSDAFGTFGTTFDCLTDEMRRYYFNICGKYGAPVSGLLRKLKGLDIKRICTLHGPVLESWEVLNAVENYRIWASYQPETQGVFVAYATLHGNTAEAARRLVEMLRERGVKVSEATDLARVPLSQCVSEAFRYAATVFMAPTYDAGLTPAMDDFLNHLQSKTWQKRYAAVVENGSWAPVAGRLMRKALSENFRDITILETECSIRTRLDAKSEVCLQRMADALAEIVNKK